jgi:threonine dehydrogenase-like Zn-dependent dehydrogenase
MTVQANGFYDKYLAEIREFDFDASNILFGTDAIQSIAVSSLTTGLTISSSAFVGSLIKVVVAGGGTVGLLSYALLNVTLTSGQLRQGVLSILIKPLPGAN